MTRKNYTVKQIIVKLREVELHCNQGNDLPPPNSPLIVRKLIFEFGCFVRQNATKTQKGLR